MRKFVALVAIAATLTACYRESQLRARDAALRGDLFEMRKAIDNFYKDKHRYPHDLFELVTAKYLRSIPKDPITMRADWVEVGQPDGVFDVKSAAKGKDVDGTPYRDF